MVSSARNAPSSTTVNFGISSAVEISVPRPTFAPSSAQPPRRQQAGVEREQVVARGVHQPLGGPQLPADAAAHRVVALGQSTATAPARRSPSAPRRRPPRPASPRASTAAAGTIASVSEAASRTAQPITARPDAQRQQRQRRRAGSTSRRTSPPTAARAAAGGRATDGGPCRTSPQASPSSTGRS